MESREGAWRDFFEVAPGSFVVVDHGGVILDASPALLADLGRPQTDLRGRAFADVVHVRDAGGPLQDGAATRCLVHASGGERWFDVTARRKDGLVYGVLVPRDAPVASGPLAGLLSPGQQLAGVLEHAPIVVFAVDRDGVFALSRGHGLRALALGQDEVTGKSLFELYAGEPSVIASVRRALDGQAFATEIESSGRRFETHFAPLRDGSGEVVGAMGIAIDVTDHHRAEERFRRLIERMPDGVAVVREGLIAYANPALVADLGRGSAGEVLGRPLAELLADDDTTTLARVEAAASSSDRLPLEEGRFRSRGGATLVAEVALMPLGDPGAPATLLVARNVTDRKAMQTRLILAERLVSLGTLAAGVAHEINNPLTYVSLNLGFMSRELVSLARELGASSTVEEPQRSLDDRRLDLRARVERTTEALRVTKEGVERVATIVRDLRTFSRAEDADRGPIDVRRVLEAAISIAWNEIRHRARLAKEYGDTLPVVANEARLAQVFVHLLLNAAHALPEGDAARHEIRVVAATDPGGRVVVEVRDTGAGIPPEIIDRIFDPFFTTKPVGIGTGLGLSVCHGIVGSLGGEITAHSPPGGGALFRVSLPAYAAPTAVDDHRSLAPASPRSPRPRALIIDDEPFVVQALRRALEADVDVVTVESGRDAIDLLLRDQRFDIILCDLMMPDIGGMDVYEAVRRARPGVEKNFVLMTGGAFTHRARDFVAAVPNRCLDKPIEPEEIRRLVMETRGRK